MDNGLTARPKAYSYLRMSTDRQLKGDSKRRQEEQSRRYAADHDLDLVEGRELEDIGVSAFKGKNLSHGALGGFVDQVRAGAVAKGSYLLVESFDRLSRQEVTAALGLFMELTNAGINVVTLSDGQLYEAGKADVMQLMYSIMVMGRAHEESKVKSQRISAAWANKRKSIGERKLTARAVGWVTLNSDKTIFELIPHRAELVRRIFQETADGIGAFSIVRRLNREGVKPFGRAVAWQKSSIDKIILSRAAIGEFQPRRHTDAGSIAAGDPIPNYYPPVVTEELFYRAQSARASRKIAGAGRKGSGISNLFSGLASCGYCGKRMHFRSKGKPPKGGTYLVCDTGDRDAGCSKATWRYSDFETSFLTYVEELDLEPFAQESDQVTKRSALDAYIQALEGRLLNLKEKRERIYEAISSAAGDIPYLAEKIKELGTEIESLESALRAKNNERDDLIAQARSFYEGRDQIKALIRHVQNAGGGGVYEMRAQISAKIRAISAGVQLFCLGEAPQIRGLIASLTDYEDPIGAGQVLDLFKAELADPEKHRPYFLFVTKDMRLRKVVPSPEDPADVHEQIVRNGEGMQIQNSRADVVYKSDPAIRRSIATGLAEYLALMSAEANRSEAE